MPGNISDWNKASDRLQCSHRIESDSPAEQQHVYHCLPSNFLNETVEFCGKNVPIEEGALMSFIMHGFMYSYGRIAFYLKYKL
jgi:hypothetical protein